MRTSCSNSIVQFDSTNVSSSVTPGDPVGILAATAFADAAYKAVLDPNQKKHYILGLSEGEVLSRSVPFQV